MDLRCTTAHTSAGSPILTQTRPSPIVKNNEQIKIDPHFFYLTSKKMKGSNNLYEVKGDSTNR